MKRTTSSARRAGIATALAFGMVALAGCAAAEEPAAPTEPTAGWDSVDPIVIRHADFTSEKQVFGASTLKFMDYVTERSEGKITFESYWSGSLIAAGDMVAGLRDGLADMGTVHPSYFPQDLPVANWVADFGYAISGSAVHDLAGGSAVAFDMSQNFQPLVDEYAAVNLKPLWYTSSANTVMLCSKAMTELSDFAGVPARASGLAQTRMLTELGATPVTVPYAESYEALQRGVIDCHVSPGGDWPPLSMTEVAKEYHHLPLTQPFYSGYAVNLDFWNGLPLVAKQLLHEAAGYTAFQNILINLEQEAAFGDALASGEVNVVDVSKVESTVAAARESGLAAMAAAAPASVADADAVVEDVVAKRAAWIATLEELGFELAESSPEGVVDSFTSLKDIDLDPFWERFRDEVVIPSAPKA